MDVPAAEQSQLLQLDQVSIKLRATVNLHSETKFQIFINCDQLFSWLFIQLEPELAQLKLTARKLSAIFKISKCKSINGRISLIILLSEVMQEFIKVAAGEDKVWWNIVESNFWAIWWHYLIISGVNVPPFDNQAINVGIVGRFTGDDTVSEAQAEALNNLINCGLAERALDIDFHIAAQCQTSIATTRCEDNNIFAFVEEHERFIETPRPV